MLHGTQLTALMSELVLATEECCVGGGKARRCSPAVAVVGSGEAASNPDSSDYRGPR